MTSVISSTAFYARIGAALFPIPHGRKAPGGIVSSFKDDWSRDPAQWERWRAEHGCNFGLVAFASNFIILDTDIKPREGQTAADARNEAWATRCELFGSWGLDPAKYPPHVTSAHGGWHDYLAVPPGIDAATLRQPDAVRGRINVRVVGYVVAAGSYYDGAEKGDAPGYYTLTSDVPPHPAPQALIEHCSPAKPRESVTKIGSHDHGDVGALVNWLNERGGFESHEDWCALGMALRLECGDAGLDLWRLAHDDTVTEGVEASKWKSFDTEPTANAVTLNSFMKRAHQLGWTGSIRPPVQTQFKGAAAQAAIDAAARAEKAKKVDSSDAPTQPANAMPVPVAHADKPAGLPRYLFETVSDLRSMPGQTWLVDRWIPDRGVGIVYGRFANGKSFVILDLILHLVYGMKEWHGIKLPGVPCHCLLIAREGSTGFQRRIDAFKKHHNIAEDTDRIVFMRSPVNFGDPAQFAELKAAIEASGRDFKAVVVDTVGRALPGEDMFDPKSITRFMEHLQQLGEISQGVAIGVHHENKAGGVMGSIYFDNSSDFMFHVERDGDPASEPLRSGKISCVKQKDGEDGWSRDVTYKLIQTEPNGEGSLVVETITAAAGTAPKAPEKLTAKEVLAMDALKDVLKSKGELGGAIGGRSVTLHEWLDKCFSNGSISGDAARPMRDLHNRQVGLIAKGRIVVLDDRVRLIGDGAKGEPGNVISMVPGLPTNGVPLPPGTTSFPIPRKPT